MKILFMDYETYSDVDIKKAGSYRYFATENFRPLLLSWAFLGTPVKVWDFTEQPHEFSLPAQVFDHINNGGIIAGWSTFDRLATEAVLHRQLPVEQYWDCSVFAKEAGFPLQLGAAGKAMRCTVKKDPVGTLAIKKFSKPNKEGEQNPPHVDRDLWDQFVHYCRHDTELMMELFVKLEAYR